jgi:phenylalanyl-tRNA synthetase beta subunit
VGLIGEFRSSVRKALKLPEYCAGFELDTAALAGITDNKGYAELSKYPPVTQDITLKIAEDKTYEALAEVVKSALAASAPKDSRFRLEPLGVYQPDDDAAHKHVTFRLTIASYTKTMTDTEVAAVLDAAAAKAQDNLGAERI